MHINSMSTVRFVYLSKLALASCSGLLLWLRRHFGSLRCDGVGRLYRMVVSGLSLCLRKEGLIKGRINCCSSTVQASRCARHDVLRRLLWSCCCSSTSLPASYCARHDILRRLFWCCCGSTSLPASCCARHDVLRQLHSCH